MKNDKKKSKRIFGWIFLIFILSIATAISLYCSDKINLFFVFLIPIAVIILGLLVDVFRDFDLKLFSDKNKVSYVYFSNLDIFVGNPSFILLDFDNTDIILEAPGVDKLRIDRINNAIKIGRTTLHELKDIISPDIQNIFTYYKKVLEKAEDTNYKSLLSDEYCAIILSWVHKNKNYFVVLGFVSYSYNKFNWYQDKYHIWWTKLLDYLGVINSSVDREVIRKLAEVHKVKNGV